MRAKGVWFAVRVLALAGVFLLGLGMEGESASAAQTTPHSIHFQGRLLDATGNARPDGLYVMSFGLYSAASGGTWYGDDICEASNRIQVTNGRFSAQIGSCTMSVSPELFTQYPLYVELRLPTPATATCAPVGCANWSEPAGAPRFLIAASPYALNSDTLDGLDSDAFAQRSANNTFTGTATFRSTTNSTSAFAIQNNSGANLLVADTTNMQLKVGGGDVSPDTLPTLLVLDHKHTSGDPAGVDGAMYYNASLQKFRCHENGVWKDCVGSEFSMRNGYGYQTDLIRSTAFPTSGYIDTSLSLYTTTNISVLPIASELGRPGIVRIGTLAAASGADGGGLLTPPDASMLVRVGAASWSYSSSVRVANATAGYSYRAGFLNALATTAENGITNGCYIRYVQATGAWEGVCRRGGAESSCSTGAAPVPGQWHTLNVAVNTNATLATFTIDDTYQCTVAANLPLSNAVLGYGTMIHRTAGTALGSTTDIDYIEVRSEFER